MSVLNLGQIRIHSGSVAKDDAMAEAAGILQDAGAVTGAYLDAMRQREQTVSTYMGNELAIPHGTNEAKDSIKRSAISFVRYPDGVDWKGKPVKFVVGIAGVNNSHMSILRKIALTFSNNEKVARLEAATTQQEVLDILGEK